jgi:hypothetical protein
VVNNEVITLSEVEKARRSRAGPGRSGGHRTGAGQKRAAALKKVLDTMIDEKLVDNELKELKVTISDKEVDAPSRR